MIRSYQQNIDFDYARDKIKEIIDSEEDWVSDSEYVMFLMMDKIIELENQCEYLLDQLKRNRDDF